MKVLSEPYHRLAMAFLSFFLGVTVVSAQGLMSRAEQPVLAALDLDADGMLSTEEVQSSPGSLRALDANNDGVLSPEETRLVLPAGRQFPPGFMGEMMQNPRIQPLMNLIDRNGDHIIDADEIENSGAAIKRLDADGDWSLSRTETAVRLGDAPAGGDGNAQDRPAGGTDMTGFDFQGSMTEANRGPFGATLFNDGVKPGEV